MSAQLIASTPPHPSRTTKGSISYLLTPKNASTVVRVSQPALSQQSLRKVPFLQKIRISFALTLNSSVKAWHSVQQVTFQYP